MVKRYKHIFLAVPIIIAISLITSCSEKITEAPRGKSQIMIYTDVGGTASISGISTFRLTVTGSGILEPIITSLIYERGMLFGTLEVPGGPERTFVLEGFDTEGVLIYSGRTITDVEPDSETAIRINLHPMVPMVKMSQSYHHLESGFQTEFKLKVFGMIDLSSIQIDFRPWGGDGWSTRPVCGSASIYDHPDSVIIDGSIADIASLNYWWDDLFDNIQFHITSINRSKIVDEFGKGELASIFFTSKPWYSGYVSFDPKVMFCIDQKGDTINKGDIYSEPVEIEIVDEWLYNRVGCWYMDGYEYADSVLDGSANNINGVAIGTSLVSGLCSRRARYFDGFNDYISILDNSLLDFPDAITLSFWVNIESISPQDTFVIFDKRSPNGSVNYQLLVTMVQETGTAGNCIFIFRYIQDYRVVAPNIEGLGWQNIMLSFNKGSSYMSDAIFALNGNRIYGDWYNYPNKTPSPNQSLIIGRQLDSKNPSYFRGSLDEFMMYDIYFEWEDLYAYFWRNYNEDFYNYIKK